MVRSTAPTQLGVQCNVIVHDGRTYEHNLMHSLELFDSLSLSLCFAAAAAVDLLSVSERVNDSDGRRTDDSNLIIARSIAFSRTIRRTGTVCINGGELSVEQRKCNQPTNSENDAIRTTKSSYNNYSDAYM